MRVKKTSGFSLLEIIIVIAIVAIIAALVVPSMTRTMYNSDTRSQVRLLIANVKRARTKAMTRERFQPGAGMGSGGGFGTPVRTRSAGVRLLSPTSYAVYLSTSRNGIGGQEAFVVAEAFDGQLEIVAPTPPNDIRFRADGTLVPGSPNTIFIVDNLHGNSYTIPLTLTGQPIVTQ